MLTNQLPFFLMRCKQASPCQKKGQLISEHIKRPCCNNQITPDDGGYIQQIFKPEQHQTLPDCPPGYHVNLSKSNKNYFICRTKEIKLSVTLVNWSLETNSEKKKKEIKVFKIIQTTNSPSFSAKSMVRVNKKKITKNKLMLVCCRELCQCTLKLFRVSNIIIKFHRLKTLFELQLMQQHHFIIVFSDRSISSVQIPVSLMANQVKNKGQHAKNEKKIVTWWINNKQRILHGRAGIRILSSSAESISLVRFAHL